MGGARRRLGACSLLAQKEREPCTRAPARGRHEPRSPTYRDASSSIKTRVGIVLEHACGLPSRRHAKKSNVWVKMKIKMPTKQQSLVVLCSLARSVGPLSRAWNCKKNITTPLWEIFDHQPCRHKPPVSYPHQDPGKSPEKKVAVEEASLQIVTPRHPGKTPTYPRAHAPPPPPPLAQGKPTNVNLMMLVSHLCLLALTTEKRKKETNNYMYGRIVVPHIL